MPTLIIVDAYNLLFRAYFALPQLEYNGLPVGAVYGFINILQKYITPAPEYLIIASDTGKSTFREKIFKEYKINRPPVPGSLTPQFALLREMVTAFSFNFIEYDGFEADDVIATLVKKFKHEKDLKIIIISSDKDLMQLVDGNTVILDPLKDKFFYAEQVKEKFGVTPCQMVDYLSLVGDVSDNIPGVPGIGPKTAASLLQQFKSIDAIDIESITKKKIKESLIRNHEQLLLSKKLVTLINNLQLPCSSLQDLAYKTPDRELLLVFLRKYGFKNIIKKLTIIENKDHIPIPTTDIAKFAKSARYSGKLAIYKNGNTIFFADAEENAFSTESFIPQEIVELFKNEAVLKIFHSENFSIENHQMHSAEDLKMIAYILNTTKTSLEDLLMEFECSKSIDISLALHKIYKKLKQNLFSARLTTLYYKVDKPLYEIKNHMHKKGIATGTLYLKQLFEEFKLRIANLQTEIFSLAGEEFLLSSPKQLSEILFTKMQLPQPKKTKTGTYSTNSEILENLSVQDFEIANKILEWRKFSKLQNTYVEPIISRSQATNRIHTNYSIASTLTGRFNSFDPNLQNIPRDLKIRKIFIAEDGYQLLAADYSQVELRILAYIADIKDLQQALLNGEDLHTITAKQIFETQNVTTELRNKAKAINFGIIYGITGFGLAKQLNSTKEEANEYIKIYFNRYPGIKDYMENMKRSARENRYVATKFGRKCYINNINSNNFVLRGIAERSAINAPIQGTAADVIRKAMVQIYRDAEIKNYLILQVHDELIFEIPETKIDSLSLKVKNMMENVIDIPLKVDVKCGRNLGEMKNLAV